MKKPKISKKLFLISKLVKEKVVADVGCDHGQLAIYLALKKNCNVYACDVRKKPLEKAVNNSKKYGVFEKISFFVSDGLKKVPFNFGCVVVAGMGGKLIEKIIFKEKRLKTSEIKLILQPQSFLFELRKNLALKGFFVEKEIVVLEKGKFYVALVARFKNKSRKISLKQAVLGKLFKEKSFVVLNFFKYVKKKHEKILQGLKKSCNPSFKQIKKVKKICLILDEAIKKQKEVN